jgi:NlpC/P60 family putative phage cell wall peptidase
MTVTPHSILLVPGEGRDPLVNLVRPADGPRPEFILGPAEGRTRGSGTREGVVAEAISWIGTPFHHAARVKGAGVDCLMLLAEVYERAGVMAHVEPPFYVADWHLHQNAERYLEGLLAYAREVREPRPGDVALFRFGRTFSHGAIVVAWPRLIHAYWAIGVVWGDATLHPLKRRPVRFFTPFVS